MSNMSILNKIKGSMIGGAIGDALGYPIEFMSISEIKNKFGSQGITDYELTNGKALVSDDTQMSLFTANGYLFGYTKGSLTGVGNPIASILSTYKAWLYTQGDYDNGFAHENLWILDVPELYSRRAPGNTCLSALSGEYDGMWCEDYIEHPINNSKGCGGVMRVAPLALCYKNKDIKSLDWYGAVISAYTHGHSLGYMPSSVLVHIINRVVYYDNCSLSLKDIVGEALNTVSEIFSDDKNINKLVDIVNLAIRLSENHNDDIDNINQLGQGWVAEEALAIAIYCSLRYQNDFSKGVIAAVNHSGDSDSTGSITGNILGAWLGFDKIEPKWKKNLELYDVIIELATDIHTGFETDGYFIKEADWERKYVYGIWKDSEDFVFFWHEYEENGYLSNWYKSSFVIDDFEYNCVEQYLMSQKAKLFHDSKRYTAILKADSPKEQKEIGRQVNPFDYKKWSKVKYDILKTAYRAKFSQNEELKKALINTGKKILAEASPYDKVWGIGLTEEEAKFTPIRKWKGENLCGKALMEVREELLNSK